MSSIDVKAPDGKTLTVQIPENANPDSYGSLADEAVKHYSSVSQSPSLPSYATLSQQQQYPVSSAISKGIGVGLETLNAPFQAIGEPIRRAVTQAQGTDPGSYRAPTIIQRLATVPLFQKLLSGIPQTKEQAPDMFSATVNPAVAGYKGMGAIAANTDQGPAQALQAGQKAVNQPPGIPEAALSAGAALGSGEVGNLPFTAAIKPFAMLGKLFETGELAGIPGTGMAAKAASGVDAVPLGLENLTAHANPELLAMQKSDNPSIARAANLMTAGGLTGSPTLNAVESFGKKLPFSSNIFQKRFGQIYDALSSIKEPIVEASKPPADLGLDVQQGLSDASNAAYGKAQSLYKNVENAIPQNTQIPLNTVQAKASELLKAQGKLPRGAQTSGAISLLQDLTSPQAKFMDYPTLQGLRAELNAKIAQANSALGTASPNAKFNSSPEARIYGQLKDSLDADMNSFSDKIGGALQSAQSDATKTYQTFKNTFKNDKFVQSILNEQNPANVVNKVISAAKDNPRALGQLKLSLPSQTLNDLQTYFIKDMTEKDPNIFSPSHFVSQYDSIGEKQLTSILGPEKMTELRPLYLLSKAGVNAEKSGQSASGPSGAGMSSAMMLRGPLMGLIGGATMGHPIKGALAGTAMLGTEMEALPLLAKGYLSKPVTQLLSRQIGMTPSFPAAGAVAQTAAKSGIPMQDLIQQLKQKFGEKQGNRK